MAGAEPTGTAELDGFAAVAQRVCAGAHLTSVRRLAGGVSAEVHALELNCPDGRRRTVVVRQHGAAAWKSAERQTTEREHALLEFLHSRGVPVAEPLLLDTSGQVLPRPFLVVSFVAGASEVAAEALDAVLDGMAQMLVRIHTLPTEAAPALPPRLDPLPELYDYLPETPAWDALRATLASFGDSAYAGPPVLLHGDFWPGNLLWQRGRLTAVLDWEDAALGDPMSDLAGCRIELLWKHGPAAMQRFTREYQRRCPIDRRRLALWEVFVAAAARHFMHAWGLPAEREQAMRSKALDFLRKAAATLRC